MSGENVLAEDIPLLDVLDCEPEDLPLANINKQGT